MKTFFLFLSFFCVFLLSACAFQKHPDGLENSLSKWEASSWSSKGSVISSLIVQNWCEYQDHQLRIRKQTLSQLPDNLFRYCFGKLSVDKKKELQLTINNLDVSGNSLTSFDQKHLDMFPNLRVLNISYNNIWTLQDLRHSELTVLFAHKNEITLMRNLSFPSLKIANFWYNNLKNLEKVRTFSKLEELELHHNDLETIDGITNLKELLLLKLEFNNIQDLSPLNGMDIKKLTTGHNPGRK